ncbi:MAG: DinB family protein [Planctomycetaceae bacterium]|nr:DinB family protein [Planctomycetaceae bacterium]
MNPADQTLVEAYQAGAAEVRQAVARLFDLDFTEAELDAHPEPGRWSIRQLVCHLADAELLYAERIKRILVEDEPLLVRADPDKTVALAFAGRCVMDEVALIESVRRHTGAILATLTATQLERQGMHSTDGRLTLRTVLERVTAHIPHHLRHLPTKQQAILAARTPGEPGLSR